MLMRWGLGTFKQSCSEQRARQRPPSDIRAGLYLQVHSQQLQRAPAVESDHFRRLGTSTRIYESTSSLSRLLITQPSTNILAITIRITPSSHPLTPPQNTSSRFFLPTIHRSSVSSQTVDRGYTPILKHNLHSNEQTRRRNDHKLDA
jgi:hypothetical protein